MGWDLIFKNPTSKALHGNSRGIESADQIDAFCHIC